MPTHLLLHLVIILLSISSSRTAIATLPAASPLLQQNRVQFIQAYHAYEKGQLQRGATLSKSLTNYPLYPYLEYAKLQSTISAQTPATIADFAKKYADTPLPKQLEYQWLNHLATQQHWQMFQQHYRPASNAVALDCHYLMSQIKLANFNQEQLTNAITQLWLSPKSQPKSCDPVFAYWFSHGGLTNDLAWQRIELTMATRQRTLAKYLKRFIKPEEQKYVDLWLHLDLQPEQVTKTGVFNFVSPVEAKIIVHALKRLANKDGEQAIQAWHNINQLNVLNPQQRGEVMAHFGLLLALRNHPDAPNWLTKIPDTHVTTAIHEWRVRNAITNDNWKDVAYWINRQPQTIRAQNTWQYWQARALEQLNDPQPAHAQYQLLAKDLNYYGLLASERLAIDYQFEQPSSYIDASTVHVLHQQPGIKRARELYALHRLGDARREWQLAMQRLDRQQQFHAATIAQSWGWHDRAISTSKLANVAQHSELLFPLANSHEIFKESKRHSVNPAWIFSIARQESRFIRDAKSPVGALGIMQVMPETAWRIAKEKNLHYQGRLSLLDAKTNINLGTAYLRKMADLYQNNIILTAAAYNAGPGKVTQWLPTSGTIAADVWIDTIPYAETRKYLQNVLTNIVVYDRQLGKESKLGNYMGDIK